MLGMRIQPRGLANVWPEMDRLQHEMNRLFSRYGMGNGGSQAAPSYPAVNIWQDDDNLYCEAELPGMELDDLEMYVSGGNLLTIKGKRHVPSHENATWHRRERGYGSFVREFALPEEVDPDNIEAKFCHGVLCMTMPKREESKPRQIEVKAS